MVTATITVPRSNVTADEVTAVLRGRLGSRYTITPGKRAKGFGKEVSGDANSLLVAGSWLERATVEIAGLEHGTEIEVSPGATYFGLIRLVHRIGLVRKIHNALAHAPELAGAPK